EYHSGEFLFGFTELPAGVHALCFEKTSLDQLCPSGLQCEVSLGKRNFRLARIPVLGNQIAGVAGEHDVVDLSLAARADVDHFVNVNKMVRDTMSRDVARRFGLGYGTTGEIPPFGIPQEMLNIARQPEF